MMMLELEGGGGGGGGGGGSGGGGGVASGDFLSVESHNVSLDGDFSIQVQWFGSPCQYHFYIPCLVPLEKVKRRYLYCICVFQF